MLKTEIFDAPSSNLLLNTELCSTIMALVTAGSFASTVEVLKVMSQRSHDWYDVKTNEVIPKERIGETTNKLIEAGQKLDDAQKAWIREIKSNGGDKEAASNATEHIIPGGKTKLFDALSRDKCLVNVRIVGPPLILADMDEKKRLLSTRSIKWLCMMS